MRFEGEGGEELCKQKVQTFSVDHSNTFGRLLADTGGFEHFSIGPSYLHCQSCLRPAVYHLEVKLQKGGEKKKKHPTETRKPTLKVWGKPFTSPVLHLMDRIHTTAAMPILKSVKRQSATRRVCSIGFCGPGS